MRHKIFLFFVLLLITSSVCRAIVLGSNTAPSRQAHAFFPAADGDNKMQGFGAFENGFSLDTSATTCIFDSYYPIEGGSVFNNGQLTLAKRLEYRVPFYFGPGTVVGNESPCVFSAQGSATDFPAQDSISVLGVLDSENLGGVVYSVDWSFDGQYVAVGAAGATNDLSVYSFDGSSLTLLDSINMGSGIVASVRWHPSEYRLAVAKTSVSQLEIYFFNTSTNTLSLTSGVALGTFALAVAWTPNGNYVAVGLYNSTALSVYPVTAGSLGAAVTYTFPAIRTIQVNALEWDSTSTYLAAGVSVSAGNSDVVVFEFNGSTLVVNAGVETTANVLGVAWRASTTQLAVGLNNALNRVELFNHNSGAGTLTSLTTAAAGVAIQEVDWNSSGTKLALVKSLSASNNECQILSFDATNTKFNHIAGTNLGSFVNDVRWSPNGLYVATADSASTFSVLGFTEGTLTFQDTHVMFDGDITVQGNLAFQNNCTVSGDGTILDVSGGKTITIASGAKLRLENIFVKGLQAGTFVFTDTTSELYLANVGIELAASVNTTTGKVFVDGPTIVVVKGNTWTFDTNALLTVDGVTLWKDPAGAGTAGEIAFGSPQATFLTLLNDGVIQEVTNKAAVDNVQSQITSNDTDIGTNATNIATNVTNIGTNATNIATNVTDIGTNTTAIGVNATAIGVNATNISSNDTDIGTNVTSIGTNATNIATSVTNIASNAAAIAALGGGVGMVAIVGDVNFTDAHIPTAGSATLFQFDKSHGEQSTVPKLIFDPTVFDGSGPNCPGGGVIMLPADRRLVIFGEGIVEFKDGVTLTFQGTTADSIPATTDWPALVVQEAAEVRIATGATVIWHGKGIITIMEDSKINLDNPAHLIFGSGPTDKLDVNFLGGSLLSIDDPGALVSFCDSECNLMFVASYLNILRGALEINRSNGVYKPGYLKNFILKDAACLTVDGTAPNSGVLHASPNQGDVTTCFDNVTALLAGNGTLRYTSVSGAQTFDLIFNRRMVRKDVTALQLVCELSMPAVGPTEDASVLAPSTTASGGLVIPSQATPGLLLPLQPGDHGIIYDSTGDGVWGYNSAERLFHVKEDGTREVSN